MSIRSILPKVEGGEKKTGGSVSWKLENGRVGRKIDGLESVKQAAELALTIPRYQHMIYSWKYGSELETLIGESLETVKKRAPELIREALSQDERILEVTGFSVTAGSQPGSADISFTIQTSEGSFSQQIRL